MDDHRPPEGSTLRDLLEQAGEAAPEVRPGSLVGGEIWEHWQRVRQRQRQGTAVILAVCCVLLLALGLATWDADRPRTVQPTGRPSTVQPPGVPAGGALPSRIYTPSPWLPSTKAHPIGPLSVMFQAKQGSRLSAKKHDQPVGISAVTGEYRFLDLPDLAHGDMPTMSPDGRRTAYWYVGKPDGAPWRANKGDPVYVGVAVYDTVTGRVQHLSMHSRHGLSAGSAGLVWADDDQLVFQAQPYVSCGWGQPESNGSCGDSMGWRSWEPTTGRVHKLPDIETILAAPGRGRLLITGGHALGRRAGTMEIPSGVTKPIGPNQPTDDRPAGFNGLTDIALDPTGTRLAVISGSGIPGPLGVRDADNRLHETPKSAQTWGIVGWSDARIVVVLEALSRGHGLSRVDVDTGERETLVRTGNRWLLADYALDLLDKHSYDFSPPPSSPHAPHSWIPRVTPDLVIGILCAGLLAIWGWRRRAAR